MRISVIYSSLTGNTEELTDLIVSSFGDSHTFSVVNVYDESLEQQHYDFLADCDLALFGSYTWDDIGRLPDEMKDVLRDIIKDKQIPLRKVAVYGTGDMSWGHRYCRAVDEMEHHLSKVASVVSTLKIEQAPGTVQLPAIEQFVKECNKQLLEVE